MLGPEFILEKAQVTPQREGPGVLHEGFCGERDGTRTLEKARGNVEK